MKRRRSASRSILCPVDFSKHSRAALRQAATLAGQERGRLTVLYVNDPLLSAAAAAAAYDRRALAQKSERELHRFAVQALAAVRRKPRSLKLVTVLGKPVHEIVKASSDYRCDLIVMGTQGRGGAARLFLGSTTEGVLRRTDVPVLVIPPWRRRVQSS
jgi:nucleotide-binding universal stress UspA family protein